MKTDEFRHIVTPLQDRLYRLAFNLTGNRDDALDAIQETLIDLWQNRQKLEVAENRQAYCFATLKNRSISLIRRRKATDSLDGARLSADNTDIASLTEQRDELRMIRMAIDNLPSEQRRVIRLSAFAQCTNAEISEITGLSDQNVRASLSRARRKLKELFNNKMRQP